MASVFTKIIRGELPAHVVWRDDRAIVFLSINPLRPGHALVVPVEEIDHWLDLDEDLRNHLMGVAHAIGRAIERVYSPEKVGLMLAGLEVPHAHIHVVPIWTVRDLDFGNAESNPPEGSLAEAAASLRDALVALGHGDAVSRASSG